MRILCFSRIQFVAETVNDCIRILNTLRGKAVVVKSFKKAPGKIGGFCLKVDDIDEYANHIICDQEYTPPKDIRIDDVNIRLFSQGYYIFSPARELFPATIKII